MDTSINEFDQLVVEAIESIAFEFRKHLSDVPVIVEQLPNEEICQKLHLKSKYHLLGLFQGVPIQHQKLSGGPSQITLYRQNIIAQSANRQALAHQIRKVIIHELGHYLGFSEQQLRDHHY
ncbi:MAG: metallopeptidase family protein [Phycisphaerae bacterium]|nr:metallopeptidase family protein [Phycisphaerae bacterium]